MTTPTEILNKLFELMKLKNSDYGNSFMNSLERFNLIAAIVRISDKIDRLVSLNSKAVEEVNFESLKDTYEDLLNYCLMTVVYIKYGLLSEKKFPEYYEIIKNEVEDYYNSNIKLVNQFPIIETDRKRCCKRHCNACKIECSAIFYGRWFKSVRSSFGYRAKN